MNILKKNLEKMSKSKILKICKKMRMTSTKKDGVILKVILNNQT